jgi:DNA (cytosine-5)-methyltransferase 1
VNDQPLVLSLFPGIGLLDMAFELEGFCVVRGPDVLWGGDIRRFSPPAGRFDGVIGGPPCQPFSRLVHIVRANGYEPRHENLIPEFERVVEEAGAAWFLMEEVPEAPVPQPRGYWPAYGTMLNNRWLGEEQNRLRRFSFATRFDVSPNGLRLDISPDVALFENPDFACTVAASGGGRDVPVAIGGSGLPKRSARSAMRNRGYQSADGLKTALRLQGLPETFLDEAPFTLTGKYRVVGNGVPLPMGRAIARAVRRALGLTVLSDAPPATRGATGELLARTTAGGGA